MFDVHTFRSASGSEVKVHFNIDIPLAAELASVNQVFQEKAKP
jgi:hypothetical protein